MLNNFQHDKLHLKIKFKCLKRDEVNKLMQNGKMTGINEVLREKRGMISEILFVKMFRWSCWTTSLLKDINWKSRYSAYKGE